MSIDHHRRSRRLLTTPSPVLQTRLLQIGYALFEPNPSVKANVTAGVVSRVVWYEGRPAIIRTDAAVHKVRETRAPTRELSNPTVRSMAGRRGLATFRHF